MLKNHQKPKKQKKRENQQEKKKEVAAQKKQKVEPPMPTWIGPSFYEGPVEHYRGCIVEKTEYYLNDAVFLASPSDSKPYIGRVVSFWDEIKGKGNKKQHIPFCKIQWFYRQADLPANCHAKSDNEHHIFASDHYDDNPVAVIEKKCQVQDGTHIKNLEKYMEEEDHFYYDKIFIEEGEKLVDV